MSEPLSLSAPTINEIESTEPNLDFLDPRKDDQKGPDAIVPQAEMTVTVDKQPSRLTNLGVNEAGDSRESCFSSRRLFRQ